MPDLKFALADVADVKLGTTDIAKVMLGSSELWPALPAGGPTIHAVGSVVEGLAGTIGPAVLPAHAANDILVLLCETDNAATIGIPSGGWANVASPNGIGSTQLNLMWLRASGSGTTNPSFSGSGNHTICVPYVVRGCITSGNPWDFAVSSTGASGAAAFSITGGTTLGADRLVCYHITNPGGTPQGTAAFSNWANAALSGVTEHIDHNRTIGNDGALGMAAGVKVAAGATGPMTGTMDQNTSSRAQLSVAWKG